MGGKGDFALCFETICIYEIPLTAYSSKIPARITRFDEIYSRYITFSLNFIYKQIGLHLCIISLAMPTFP